jgi:hypothetical protein
MATIVVVMNKEFEDYKAGKQYSVEITLARRYIENGIAIPLSVHLENQVKAQDAKDKAERMKKESADKKKAALLKKKEEDEMEKADSKKAKSRSKQVKK